MVSSPIQHSRDYHNLEIYEIIESLDTDLETGLSAHEAESRLIKHGYNDFMVEQEITLWKETKDNLSDGVTIIFCLISIISFVISLFKDQPENNSLPNWLELLIVLLVLFLSAFIEAFKTKMIQETNKKTREFLTWNSLVLRMGCWKKIPSKDIVPGDIIQIEEGDKVPCDMRLASILSSDLFVDQSILSGDTYSQKKTVEAIAQSDLTFIEKYNMCFGGTIVTQGKAIGIATATGKNSVLGSLSMYLVGSYSEIEQSHLESEFDNFTDNLSKILSFFCIIILVNNFQNYAPLGGNLEGLLDYSRFILPLVIIPSGFYTVFSNLYSICAHKLAIKGAITKRISCLNHLANTNVICCDMESVIMDSQMTVKEVILYDETVDWTNRYDDNKQANMSQKTNFLQLCRCISKTIQLTKDRDKRTKIALKNFIDSLIQKKEIPSMIENYNPIEKDLKFSKEFVHNQIQFAAHSVMLKDGSIIPLENEEKSKLLHKVDDMINKGMKPIVFLREEDQVFLGIIGVQEHIRPEVVESIAKLRRAGIKIIIMTHRSKESIQWINNALRTGNLSENEDNICSLHKLESMLETERQTTILKLLQSDHLLFATNAKRNHKTMLYTILESCNQIVAMTTSECVALKKAHIGIALGVNSTDVAREAADLVLADDSLNTIVNAIEQSRITHSNLQALIQSMLTSQVGLMLIMLAFSGFGLPGAFTPIQLFWLGLILQLFQILVFNFDYCNPEIMEKSPQKQEPLVTQKIFFAHLTRGSYMCLATIVVFIYWYTDYNWAEDRHSLVTFTQLSSWTQCLTWPGFEVNNFDLYTQLRQDPCSYFTVAKQKPLTISFVTLMITIMFFILSSINRTYPILKTKGQSMIRIVAIIALFMLPILIIMNSSWLMTILGFSQLDKYDWMLVLVFSVPALLIEKFIELMDALEREYKLRKDKKKV